MRAYGVPRIHPPLRDQTELIEVGALSRARSKNKVRRYWRKKARRIDKRHEE